MILIQGSAHISNYLDVKLIEMKMINSTPTNAVFDGVDTLIFPNIWLQ